MYGKMNSACLYGIEGIMIGVEIDIASGLPLTTIIGLPDSAIREAVERVRAAVKNCGYRYPQQRITINLAPADLRKEGSAFDLAIAVGILATSGQLVIPAASDMLLIGELALDGSIRSVNGVLPMVEAARSAGFRSVLLPRGNAAEAALISGMSIYTADHLNELPEPGRNGLPACSEISVPQKICNSLNEEKSKIGTADRNRSADPVYVEDIANLVKTSNAADAVNVISVTQRVDLPHETLSEHSAHQLTPTHRALPENPSHQEHSENLTDSSPFDLTEKAAPPVTLPFPVTVMSGADARDRPPALALSLEHLRYVPVVTFPSDNLPEENEMREDYSDVLGQHHVKRALTIAAAGRHNILLMGPPGTGKTMLIKRLPGILPPLTESEALEVTKIFSAAGKLKDAGNGLMRSRPFRSPHHTISAAGLIGGGGVPKPGEVSLAHRGVLFLDELPEFSRSVLEVLRQPLEDGAVTISRARAAFTFPASFMLAVSMNPCICGFLGSGNPHQVCTCSSARIAAYRAKISGPLLDRIDLQVDVPRPAGWERQGHVLSSAEMRAEVSAAQAIQAERYRHLPISWNSELSGAALRRYASLDKQGTRLLHDILESLGLSMRAHDRIIKLARTIADLSGAVGIRSDHLAEAVQYRNLDRQVSSVE